MSAVLGLTTAAALVAPAGSAGVEPAANASGGGQVQSFWLHMNSTPVDEKTLVTEAKRRSYVVLNAWEGDLAARFKAVNPAIELFVYKDLSSTRSYACRNGVDDEHLPAGIGFCEAQRDHPEWFLLDSGGKRFEYGGYSGHWQMDVGNTAYQRAWARNVVASAKAGGFDGVFMDNALFPCDAYHEGVCPAKYPTDAAIQDAYTSMLANTRDEFVSAGLKTVANLSNARLHAGAWDAYTEHLDGGFDEWWLTFDDANLLPEYAEGWSRQVAEIAANEARGKITWVQPHFSPDAERPYRYALASYLMAAGGRAAFADVHRTDGYGDASPWRAEYDWDLGTPSGPYRSVARNVYQRDFACGTVIVNANPSTTAAVTVKVNGDHTDERGAAVTSVALRGTSGSILRRPC
ncbi:putative glycoside hydrolase family 15 protein [Saccharothrix xinjiangensis]|uniref:Glycoside hydrolase family 15 protein n=1 Tax=Saccharothrix xinjiangensis TaxID=204798 RepID=A0ABV9Y6N4_9PSEU